MEFDAQQLTALNELLDRQQIMDCLLRYTRGIDRHDSELVASAYHPSAIDDHTDYIGTGENFGEYANATHDASWDAHQHYMTNTTIEFDGHCAHVETYWLVAGRRKGSTESDVHGGRYVDRFEKRGGKWAIAARICVYEWGLRAEDAAACITKFPLGGQDGSDVSYLRPLDVQRSRTV